MKKNIILLIAGIALCSCGNNGNSNSTTFQPKGQPNMAVTKGPGASQTIEGNGIKLSVILPDDANEPIASILSNRLKNIAATNGILTDGVYPAFVVLPKYTELKRDITSTTPPKHTVEYDLTLYVGNLVTGDVYSSANISIVGVGESDELADRNAFNSISGTDDKIVGMLKEGTEKILEYINANSDAMIAEALSYSERAEYGNALAILSSIPASCECYKKVIEIKDQVLTKSFAADGEIIVAKMKAALMTPKNNDEGYSEEFLALYTLLPANSPSKAEADILYKDYCAKSDKAVQQKMANKQKEWEKNLNDQDAIRQMEFEKYKAELTSDTIKSSAASFADAFKNRRRGLLGRLIGV